MFSDKVSQMVPFFNRHFSTISSLVDAFSKSQSDFQFSNFKDGKICGADQFFSDDLSSTYPSLCRSEHNWIDSTASVPERFGGMCEQIVVFVVTNVSNVSFFSDCNVKEFISDETMRKAVFIFGQFWVISNWSLLYGISNVSLY